MEKLICQDFYYKPDGYDNTPTAKSGNDLTPSSRHIRIYGTQVQVDLKEDEYRLKYGLRLDECYDYKIETKETWFWYEHKMPLVKQNEGVFEKLKEYNQKYFENGNNAVLINFR